MFSCRPIQGCIDRAPGLTLGFACIITLTALTALSLGAARLITHQSPIAFFNERWALSCVITGSVATTLGLSILCQRRQTSMTAGDNKHQNRSHTPEPEDPLPMFPPKDLTINRFGHTIQLPSPLIETANFREMPPNSFYRRSDGGCTVNAQIQVDGETIVFYQEFGAGEPLALLRTYLSRAQNFLIQLNWPTGQLNNGTYCLLQRGANSVHYPKSLTAVSDCGDLSENEATYFIDGDHIAFAIPILINGTKQDFLNIKVIRTDAPIEEQLHSALSQQIFYDLGRMVIFFPEYSYTLEECEWTEKQGEEELTAGEYLKNGNQYTVCHRLLNERGHYHTGTLTFTSHNPLTSRTIFEELVQQILKGIIQIKRPDLSPKIVRHDKSQ